MDLLPTIDRLAQKGAAQFANWDPLLFHAYCQGVLPRLVQHPKASPAVVNAFSALLCEGVGRGYLARSLHANPTNLMEYCFRDWLVSRLAALATEQQLPFLADAWNLLEGL